MTSFALKKRMQIIWLMVLHLMVVMIVPSLPFLLPPTEKNQSSDSPIRAPFEQQRNKKNIMFDGAHRFFATTLNGNEQESKEELKKKLPPMRDPSTMSKLEIEFRELLEGILYSPSEIEAIASPRIRCIYEGIAASYYEPAVYRAFEVLYEDYLPLRVAGRLVYSRLKEVMSDSNEYRQNQFNDILQATNAGLAICTLRNCWSSYVRLVQDQELIVENNNNDSTTTKLLGCIENRIAAVLRTCSDDESNNSYEELRRRIDFLNTKGHVDETLTFSYMVIQLYNFAIETPGGNDDINRDPEQFLSAVWNLDYWESMTTGSDFCVNSRLEGKRIKYNAKYDDMIHQFREWEAYIPENGAGRRFDILKGCFVGSDNPEVVQALRVIYTDNAALRMSGDWIFKVVATIMNTTMKRRSRRNRR